ncbi:hypothetical protein ERJ75_001594400 [Trypanosoma vivax]|uniref:Uncharacterized protein n=1 Tax=Trypanosoma vivax (strain Y486) TaxID=1055687 RepID=G0TSE5_TRYVY|nr:hypothetical protein TRVL_03915 [Trypanosoma vivax]KAH8605707.1 hypothetical protein ERJ75_001594400 [Trypanosoma vivax]CCC46872.1 conserved hypothetical protein [Trypanosoma vivax Y486]
MNEEVCASSAPPATEDKRNDAVPNSPTVTIAPNLPYTEEEMNLLSAHLGKPGLHEGLTDEVWRDQMLPLLCGMVEKALQLAAEAHENAKKGNGVSDYGAQEEGDRTEMSGEKKGNVAQTLPSVENADFFAEENVYILGQLRLQPSPFFTLPRLWEILADPYRYNCSAAGVIRGEKLQAALRRCVLVSAPIACGSTPSCT